RRAGCCLSSHKPSARGLGRATGVAVCGTRLFDGKPSFSSAFSASGSADAAAWAGRGTLREHLAARGWTSRRSDAPTIGMGERSGWTDCTRPP
ncbi:hypothetical protein ABTK42_19250, partial [Acinetobacter baumannii]